MNVNVFFLSIHYHVGFQFEKEAIFTNFRLFVKKTFLQNKHLLGYEYYFLADVIRNTPMDFCILFRVKVVFFFK